MHISLIFIYTFTVICLFLISSSPKKITKGILFSNAYSICLSFLGFSLYKYSVYIKINNIHY